MQSRLSTHRPDGSLADDDVVVCEVCELPLFELVLLSVFVVVVLSAAVDEDEV